MFVINMNLQLINENEKRKEKKVFSPSNAKKRLKTCESYNNDNDENNTRQ